MEFFITEIDGPRVRAMALIAFAHGAFLPALISTLDLKLCKIVPDDFARLRRMTKWNGILVLRRLQKTGSRPEGRGPRS